MELFKMWPGCYTSQGVIYAIIHHKSDIKSNHVGSITDDVEPCQNEISALATRVNGCDFALGQDSDLLSPRAHTYHHLTQV